jgi:hypothetical protein
MVVQGKNRELEEHLIANSDAITKGLKAITERLSLSRYFGFSKVIAYRMSGINDEELLQNISNIPNEVAALDSAMQILYNLEMEDWSPITDVAVDEKHHIDADMDLADVVARELAFYEALSELFALGGRYNDDSDKSDRKNFCLYHPIYRMTNNLVYSYRKTPFDALINYEKYVQEQQTIKH